MLPAHCCLLVLLLCQTVVVLSEEETLKGGSQRERRQISIQDGRVVFGFPSLGGGAADRSERPCTTPDQRQGLCQDLTRCPHLLLDLNNLRQSICFQSLFVPGVCCPGAQITTTTSSTTTTQSTTTTTTTTSRTPLTQLTTVRPTVAPTTRPTTVTPAPISLECGIPQSPSFRVVGGEESRPGQWPWMAAIFLHGPRSSEFWCGGSLISRQYIITAAHCTKDTKGKSFDPRQFSVRLGDHNLFSKDDDFQTPQTFGVETIKVHPDFRISGFYNDVALFRLDRPVEYTNAILPVCLPDELVSQPLDSLVGRTPSVIGWGTQIYGGEESPALRDVKVPVWTNQDCDKSYFQPIGDTFICAGFVEGGKDACQGDSGGPLQLFNNGRWIQVGIVSFGNRCAEPGYPGVYTRITHYLNWIYRNLS